MHIIKNGENLTIIHGGQDFYITPVHTNYVKIIQYYSTGSFDKIKELLEYQTKPIYKDDLCTVYKDFSIINGIEINGDSLLHKDFVYKLGVNITIDPLITFINKMTNKNDLDTICTIYDYIVDNGSINEDGTVMIMSCLGKSSWWIGGHPHVTSYAKLIMFDPENLQLDQYHGYCYISKKYVTVLN